MKITFFAILFITSTAWGHDFNYARVEISTLGGAVKIDKTFVCYLPKESIEGAKLLFDEARFKKGELSFDYAKCSFSSSRSVPPTDSYSFARVDTGLYGKVINLDGREVCKIARYDGHEGILNYARLTHSNISIDVKKCTLSLAESIEQKRLRELEAKVKHLESEALVCNGTRVNDSSGIKHLKDATIPVIKKAGQSPQ